MSSSTAVEAIYTLEEVSSVRLRSRAVARYFIALGSALVALNVLTFFYHLTGGAVFNVASYVVSVALIVYSCSVILRSGGNDIGRTFLTVAGVAVSLSAIANVTTISAVDILKYLSIYIFYAAGRTVGGRMRWAEMKYLYLIAALPILFLPLGSSKIYDSDSLSYLPNANTAVLYFSAILFAASPLLGNYVIVLQFINAAVMNKIGAIVATVIAAGLWVLFPLRRESVIALVVVAVAGVLAIMLGAFDRAIGAFDNLLSMYRLEPSTVATMSYKDLVKMTGSTDLSGFFRVIHWSNIWDLYSSQGIGTLLLGYGAGQTVPLTYAALVPHNDYLRILAEYGIINFLIFVTFLIHVRLGLQNGAAKVLFVVLCVYFFSENLIDNFTSMALYFAYAGREAAENASGPNQKAGAGNDRRAVISKLIEECSPEMEKRPTSPDLKSKADHAR